MSPNIYWPCRPVEIFFYWPKPFWGIFLQRFTVSIEPCISPSQQNLDFSPSPRLERVFWRRPLLRFPGGPQGGRLNRTAVDAEVHFHPQGSPAIVIERWWLLTMGLRLMNTVQRVCCSVGTIVDYNRYSIVCLSFTD